MSHRENTNWLCGLHSVTETVRAAPKRVRELWVLKGRGPEFEDLIKTARAAGASVRFVEARDLERLSPRHQDLAVRVVEAPPLELDDLLETLGADPAAKEGMVLVALDQIQDPHNLGAIARSAANLGAAGLLLPERRSAPVTPAAIAASAGAFQHIPVYHVVNLTQALVRLREAGFWIYGADAAGLPAWESQLNLPLVLVIGSEGQGLRPLVAKTCDELVRVPQSSGGVESLNASCAASVLLYEIARRRGRSEG